MPNVTLIGFFMSSNGLGQAARNIAYSLESTPISFSCVDINTGGLNRDDTFAGRCSPYHPNYINLAIAGIDMTESIAEQISRLGRAKKNYFYPFWELDRIPSRMLKAISSFDKIIAPSAFIANSFQKYMEYEVPIIAQPVLIPQHAPVNHIEGGVLKVFCMMDLASFVARKNPMGALAAFLMAFPPSIENVRLIIKIKGERDLGLRGQLNQYCTRDARIQVIDGDLRRDEVAALIDKCNVFLSLHRSEGFGFGPAEAMACGKIVVATDYGGVTDFLNDLTGYPVPYKLTAVQEGEYLFGENQLWAEPSVLDAASALKEIYQNFELSLRRAKQGRQLMIENFSFQSVGKKLHKFFESE